MHGLFTTSRFQAHLASLGAAVQTQQLTDQLNPGESVDELDGDMDLMEALDEMNSAIGDLDSAADDLAAAAEAISEALPALSGPLKIIVTQFQIMSAITVTMPIGWPDLISKLSVSVSFLRLDLPAVFGLGCIWSVNQVMFAVVGTTFVLVVLAIVAALMRLFFDRSRKDAANFFFTWAQAVAFLVYPEVNSECLFLIPHTHLALVYISLLPYEHWLCCMASRVLSGVELLSHCRGPTHTGISLCHIGTAAGGDDLPGHISLC